MQPVEPIDTVALFPPLSRELLTLLASLAPADWARPTACAGWSVKDVAAHLLGGNLGRLWRRDERSHDAKPSLDYVELVALINRSNAEWVQAARRISPEILIAFLDLTDRRLYDHLASLPPDDPAPIAVAWAGDDPAPNWFDIAREYTEKWLHQQHIREAVGAPLLAGREWLRPVLDTFLRGLPRAYRAVSAEDGVGVGVEITGEAGGAWTLRREGGRWRLYAGGDPGATCRVTLDADTAWRLFTKALAPEEARRRAQIEGDARLGAPALGLTAIMA